MNTKKPPMAVDGHARALVNEAETLVNRWRIEWLVTAEEFATQVLGG